MQLPTFLFINGPAGSGKSTLASLLCEANPYAWRDGFAEPIRQMMYSTFFPEQGPIEYTLDLRKQEVKALPPRFPVMSHQPFPRNIVTNRDIMISWSEDWMKKIFGDQIFGKLLFERWKEQQLFSSTCIVDDSGFAPEAEYIMNIVGEKNCAIVHLKRPGCDFSGDSRGYLYSLGKSLRHIEIENVGEPSLMVDQLQLVFGNL